MSNEITRGPLGVRKVSERIVKEGRSLIITDRTVAEWKDIPFGAIYVDPVENLLYIKSYDNEDDWTLLEFGTYIPPIDPGVVDAWEPGTDIPTGGLTPQQIADYVTYYEDRIKEIEEILVGTTSIWLTYTNKSDHIRQLRTKIIDIFEGIAEGSSLTFAAMPSTNMVEAFNTIKTGGDIIIEIISGLVFGTLDLARIQINELYEIIYPSSFIVNEFATAAELAENTADIYRIIGADVPGELSPSYIATLTDNQVATLLDEEIEKILIIYAKTQNPVIATRMANMSLDVAAPVAMQTSESDELMERIRMLEEQISLLATT